MSKTTSDLDETSVLEAAYVKAAEQEYGSEYAFWARSDDAGVVSVAQVLRVVDTVRDPYREVKLDHIRQQSPEITLGQYVVNPVDCVEPGETHVRAAEKSGIIKHVRVTLS